MVQRGGTCSVWGEGPGSGPPRLGSVPDLQRCLWVSGSCSESKGVGTRESEWPWVGLRGRGEGTGGSELGALGTPVPALRRGGRLPSAGAGSGHRCLQKPPQMTGEPGRAPVRPNSGTLTFAFHVISILFF